MLANDAIPAWTQSPFEFIQANGPPLSPFTKHKNKEKLTTRNVYIEWTYNHTCNQITLLYVGQLVFHQHSIQLVSKHNL